MTAIHDTFINAILADAAYVNGLAGLNAGDLSKALTGRMTPELAKYISDQFEVVTQFGDSSAFDGFNATVWREKKSGKLTVSFRGTQEYFDFTADADLATRGIPYTQLADLVNWWLRETTPVGQLVKQIGVALISVGGLPISTFVAASSVYGTGNPPIDPTQVQAINGHSLGGYLATSFARLFGQQFSSNQIPTLETFNSAGFSAPAALNIDFEFKNIANLLGSSNKSLSDFRSDQKNFFAQNGINVTTNDADPFGFAQKGVRIPIFQEESTGSVGANINNHFVYKITDLLALGNALELLDPSITIDKLGTFVKLGSNKIEASYEGILDGLRKTLSGQFVTDTKIGDANGTNDGQPEARLDFHKNLAELTKFDAQGNPTGIVASLQGKAQLSTALPSNARNDLGQFLSLYYLTPFTLKVTDPSAEATLLNVQGDVGTAWQADKERSAAERLAGSDNFSDEYLVDRTAFLSWIIKRNQTDIADDAITGPEAYFNDLASNTTIRVGAAGVPDQDKRQFLFGDNKNNTLQGGSKNDRLYGGTGNDSLIGGHCQDYIEGNVGIDLLFGGKDDNASDILKGGEGTDGYYFDGQFGKDKIIDSDGLGSVLIDGNTVGTAKGAGKLNHWTAELSGNVYADLAVFNDSQSSTGKRLVISKIGDTSNSITINNFDLSKAQSGEGYLGIKLSKTPQLVITKGGGKNRFTDPNFDPASLAAQSSQVTEGGGTLFTIFLDKAAKAGDTVRLNLTGSGDFKFEKAA